MHAPLLRRAETLPSQLCDIRFPSRTDVPRCKFKSFHWPGTAWLFPLTSHPTFSPDSETEASWEPECQFSRKGDGEPGGSDTCSALG